MFQLNLFCSGSPLEDEYTLGALENLTIDLTVPLLGGKVHGSLARAGKVRGQTPKVRRLVTLCSESNALFYRDDTNHAPLLSP